MREAAAVRRGRDGVDGATSAHPLPSAPAAGVLFGDVHVARFSNQLCHSRMSL